MRLPPGGLSLEWEWFERFLLSVWLVGVTHGDIHLMLGGVRIVVPLLRRKTEPLD